MLMLTLLIIGVAYWIDKHPCKDYSSSFGRTEYEVQTSRTSPRYAGRPGNTTNTRGSRNSHSLHLRFIAPILHFASAFHATGSYMTCCLPLLLPCHLRLQRLTLILPMTSRTWSRAVEEGLRYKDRLQETGIDLLLASSNSM